MQKMIDYLYVALITKKILYYFLIIIVLRFYFFFRREGLKKNPGSSAICGLVIFAAWEHALRSYIVSWVFHVPAILLTGYYIAISIRRIESQKNKAGISAHKKKMLVVMGELIVLFFLLLYLTAKTATLHFI